MKKQLNITWNNVQDSTGYLFSFAKSLSCAVRNSPYAEFAEDIIATSGFAFRMWITADLCPSATSIWDFDSQKPWVENGGLLCNYAGRYWGQEHLEKEKQLEAIENIKKSIDNGIAAISWDIGVPEWGLITGYDDETQNLFVQQININEPTPMPYDVLGKRELPILSVLTITGKSDKAQDDILNDTMKLAVTHLNGEEWCDNAKGLEAYPRLISIFEDNRDLAASWNADYFLGTYGALKEFAYIYFEKSGQTELAQIYKEIFESWLNAFKIKTSQDAALSEVRAKIVSLLQSAYKNEKKAVEIMTALIK